eukprot:COSAG01_NODE_61648_length_288_cov_1.275132_1_plen_42_part_01
MMAACCLRVCIYRGATMLRPCHSSPVALVFGLVVCAQTAGAQ